MSKRSDKYLICAAVNAELGYDEVIKQVDKFPAIVICDVKGSLRNQILKYCYGKSIRVYITPKLSDIIIGGSEEIHLFDTPLFLCRNSGLSLDQQVAKRALDLICGVLAFIVASPFMLITAAAIKLYDGGPVLFKQKMCIRDSLQIPAADAGRSHQDLVRRDPQHRSEGYRVRQRYALHREESRDQP